MSKLIIVLAVFCFMLHSSGKAQQTPQSLISREWRLVQIKNPLLDAKLDSLNMEDRMNYEAMLTDKMVRSYFIFRKDGTYEILMLGKDKPSAGQWEINASGTTLYTTNQAGKRLSILIEELTEESLVLKMESNGKTDTLFLVPKA